MTRNREHDVSAADFLPARKTLPALRKAAAECQGCPLFQNATQTVFGSGKSRARLMLVGEQPGDKEDLAGKPFVGPAGALLQRLLEEAGVATGEVYLTNAVKHFKWTARGKRRLHKKPSSREIFACHPWLEAELEAVQPSVIVALGATAAQSLLGNQFRVTKHRGKAQPHPTGIPVLATYHPSAILRAPDASRAEMRAAMVTDLATAARLMASIQP
jgi:uracil-DNA glycosylase family protein